MRSFYSETCMKNVEDVPKDQNAIDWISKPSFSDQGLLEITGGSMDVPNYPSSMFFIPARFSKKVRNWNFCVLFAVQ